jgi:hypothetical protein
MIYFKAERIQVIARKVNYIFYGFDEPQVELQFIKINMAIREGRIRLSPPEV